MELSQQISGAIKNYLHDNNMSKFEFAKLMGVNPSIVTRWLRGTHNFTLKTLCAIKAKTGLELFYIPKRRNIVWTNYTYTDQKVC